MTLEEVWREQVEMEMSEYVKYSGLGTGSG